MTATTCTVITCRGYAVVAVDDEMLARPTRELKPWKIRHILEEMRIATAQERIAARSR